MRAIPRWGLTLAVAVVAACGPAAPTSTKLRGAASPKVAVAASAAAPSSNAPTMLPTVGGQGTQLIGKVKLPEALQGKGTVSLADAGLISDHGAGLIGKVKAPSTLISDHGAGVVSNNGAGLIGKVKYTLKALDQVPVAGVPVFVLDAAGRVVVDAAGEPLVAVTDAAGGYSIGPYKAIHNLVAAVDLGAKGLERAVMPPGGTAPDVDLISTLTTTYILDQYVSTQADPTKTLDRLPANVEADTRAKAGAAFDTGKAPVPDDLTASRVVGAVESLRKADKGLDDQLALVKRLLILAGHADLGNGRKALEVSLGLVDGVAAAPDGTLYINTYRRVWRLDPQGRLQTAFGSGGAGVATNIDGQPADRVPLDGNARIAVDGKGRLLVLTTGDITNPAKVMRVELDGKVKLLWQGTGLGWAVVPNGDDEVWIFGGAYYANPEFWVVNGSPALKKTMTQQEMMIVDGITSTGRAPNGTLYVASQPVHLGLPPGGLPGLPFIPQASQPPTPPAGIYQFDPDAGTFTLVPDAMPGGGAYFAVDQHANVFFSAAKGAALQVHAPDGQLTQVQAIDDGDDAIFDRVELKLADGTFLHLPRNRSQLVKLAGGMATPIAGLLPGEAVKLDLPANARDFALFGPGGVAPGEGNGFFVADRDRHQIFTVDATDTIRLVAGTGAQGSGKSDPLAAPLPAEQAALRYPNALRRDGQGKLYFLEDAYGDGNAIRVLTPSGGAWTIATLVSGSATERIGELVAAPDGTIFYGTASYAVPGGSYKLYKVKAGGQPAPLAELPGQVVGLALAPDGTLYASLGPQAGPNAGGRIAKLAPGSSSPAISTSAKLDIFGGGLACDAKGRLYLCNSNGNTISRYDLATDTLIGVVGKGGTQFTGDGVDDGVKFPTYPCFNAAGDLLFVDSDHQQVKRVAAGAL